MSEIELDDEWMKVYNNPKPYNKDLYCNSINLKDGIYYYCERRREGELFTTIFEFIVLNNFVYEIDQAYWDEPLSQNIILLKNMKLITLINSKILYCKIIESE